MTQIDFYTHVDNKLRTACQLVAKAYERKLKVLIFTPDAATSDAIDKLLWTVTATGFLPHVRADGELADETPIVIDHLANNRAHDEVLINLRPEWPPFFSQFKRLIEIVGSDEADRLAARERFRFYRDRGYPIESHNRSN